MKKLLFMIGLLVPFAGFSQSNDAGVIQLGFGGMGIIGGATIKSTNVVDTNVFGDVVLAGDNKHGVAGFKAAFGLKMQYGFAERISAGIFIRRETVSYTDASIDDDAYGYAYDGINRIDAKDFSIGVEGKFYVVNKDRFNLYFGPSIGYTTGKAKIKDYIADIEGGISGINYGIGGGLNWYWGDVVGMNFDFGYTGQSLSGEPDDLTEFDVIDEPRVSKYKVSGGNIYIGLSFIAKFGGN